MGHSRLFCVATVFAVGCAEPDELPPDPPGPTGPAFRADTLAVDFPSLHCGNVQTARVPVTNLRDEPLTLDVHSDVRDIVVEPTLELPARRTGNIELTGFYRTRGSVTGTLTLSAASEPTVVRLLMAITGDPTDAQIVFDPPVLDFGKVLPNTTKDLAIQAISDESSRSQMTLAEASTPRFEVIGTNTALVSAVDRPTFTVRFIAGASATDYNETLPIVGLPPGVCVPEVIDLHATVVP